MNEVESIWLRYNHWYDSHKCSIKYLESWEKEIGAPEKGWEKKVMTEIKDDNIGDR